MRRPTNISFDAVAALSGIRISNVYIGITVDALSSSSGFVWPQSVTLHVLVVTPGVQLARLRVSLCTPCTVALTLKYTLQDVGESQGGTVTVMVAIVLYVLADTAISAPVHSSNT